MTLTREAAYDLLDLDDRDRLGEGPWWHEAQQRLYWVDITGRRVRAANLDGTGAQEWATPSEVGFVVPDEAGRLVCGLRGGLGVLDPATGALQQGVVVEHRSDHRLNDGKTDRAGRLWFGSMHDPETDPTSRFYRVDAAGVQVVFDDIITSNGLGWSPDNRTMYYTDSKTWQILSLDFDPDTGVLRNPRVFAEDPQGQYVPDGLTVDAEGCVWGAKWQGHRVVRYAPDGRLLLDLRFPVSRMTSCMFAGPRLDVLVVTSARGPEDDEPLAGRVFLVDPGTHGLGERPVPAELAPGILGEAKPSTTQPR
ncbi:MAG: SMP-30/gluconolactonase/LRE family protein [Actinomycetia bacterium]|nr:SMP-30/gluconolactonase/LRE family protein [Actinomycetes bacterium]